MRGKISSWNITAQKAFGTRISPQVGYVANRQNGMLRNQNVNYGPLGGGAASQPFNPLGITAAMNVFRPEGKVKYDSMQLSFNRRMWDGLQFSAAYTHPRQGPVGSSPYPFRVLVPQRRRHLRPAPVQRVARLRVALRQGNGSMTRADGAKSPADGKSILSSATPPDTGHRHVQFQVNECAGHQHAVPRQGQRRVTWRSSAMPGPTLSTLMSVRTGRSRRRASAIPALANGGGPAGPNVDLSLFRVFRIGQNKTLQVRAEVFNLHEHPGFSNPNTIISNVTFNADGSIARAERCRRYYQQPTAPDVSTTNASGASAHASAFNCAGRGEGGLFDPPHPTFIRFRYSLFAFPVSSGFI